MTQQKRAQNEQSRNANSLGGTLHPQRRLKFREFCAMTERTESKPMPGDRPPSWKWHAKIQKAPTAVAKGFSSAKVYQLSRSKSQDVLHVIGHGPAILVEAGDDLPSAGRLYHHSVQAVMSGSDIVAYKVRYPDGTQDPVRGVKICCIICEIFQN